MKPSTKTAKIHEALKAGQSVKEIAARFKMLFVVINVTVHPTFVTE